MTQIAQSQTGFTEVRIQPETPADAAAVDALVLAAFGPGRFAKTAERLRESAGLSLALTAYDGDRLIGSVRLWAITVGETPALFLGPIAVDAASRRGGLGGDLVRASLQAASEMDVGGVLLVGDPPYFERFGFQPAPTVELPGPVDRKRILWAPLSVAQVAGVVRATD